MDVYGATTDDFAQVKVKNSKHGLENPNARFRKENTVDDVLNSPIVADPLRLLDICATSDGAAAMIVSSMDFARASPRLAPTACRASRPSPPSRRATRRRVLELPDFATDSSAVVPPPDRTLQGLDRRQRRTRRRASAPTT